MYQQRQVKSSSPHACSHMPSVCPFTVTQVQTHAQCLWAYRHAHVEMQAVLCPQHIDAHEHMYKATCLLHKPQSIKADKPTLKTPASCHGGSWHPSLPAGSAPVARSEEPIHLCFLGLHLYQLPRYPWMGQAWGLDYRASFLEGSCRRESQ